MEFQALAAVFACLTLVECREASKTTKSAPTITSSLVNFGKMDISLHFNVNDQQSQTRRNTGSSTSFLFSKPEVIGGPCACSGLRSFKDPFVNNPSDILNKIFMSNDLFSHKKEPMTSTLCCESHEHDDFVTFELDTRHTNERPLQHFPALPFIFNNLLPNNPSSILKPKTVELIVLPKTQSFIPPITKDAIQIVGDKELRNDFKTMNLKPKWPVVTSVKKDLTAQEKSRPKTKEIKEIKLNINTFDEESKVNPNILQKEPTPNVPNALK